MSGKVLRGSNELFFFFIEQNTVLIDIIDRVFCSDLEGFYTGKSISGNTCDSGWDRELEIFTVGKRFFANGRDTVRDRDAEEVAVVVKCFFANGCHSLRDRNMPELRTQEKCFLANTRYAGGDRVAAGNTPGRTVDQFFFFVDQNAPVVNRKNRVFRRDSDRFYTSECPRTNSGNACGNRDLSEIVTM